MIATDALALWIEQHRRLGDAKLRKLLGQSDAAVSLPLFCDTRPSHTSAKAAAILKTMAGKVLLVGQPDYPRRILETAGADAPPVLYASGNLELLKSEAFAIIGTRRPSRVGREAAQEYARGLVRRGMVIVSGNAPGIDAVSHAAALQAGGGTIVFPPAPLDQFSPTFEVPQERGELLILSPFAPGSEIQPYNFLRRNTLVAALCVGAFVAETGTRGGTLDTVRKLRELRRPYWATQLNPDAINFNAHQLLISGGAAPLPAMPAAKDIAAILRLVRHRPERNSAVTHQQFTFGEAE